MRPVSSGKHEHWDSSEVWLGTLARVAHSRGAWSVGGICVLWSSGELAADLGLGMLVFAA